MGFDEAGPAVEVGGVGADEAYGGGVVVGGWGGFVHGVPRGWWMCFSYWIIVHCQGWSGWGGYDAWVWWVFVFVVVEGALWFRFRLICIGG